jgi:hypothetical protein
MAIEDRMALGRRALLKAGAATAAALSIGAPFEALALSGGRRLPFSPDYGPLKPALDLTTGLPLIHLPDGFEYASFGWTGDLMIDGQPTPGGHDGGAVFWAPWGRVVYVRNHELSYSANAKHKTSFASAALTYDMGNAPGGTTNVVFDTRRRQAVRTVPTISGTIRNCAGGATPWHSWLTCEENLDEPGTRPSGMKLEKTHGWVFEVPSVGRARPLPIEGLGRFNHEACAVDPLTSIVYETEDTGRSGLYRFIPSCYGRLRDGGKLQMLKIIGEPNLDTGKGLEPFRTFDVTWVDIADPTRRDDQPGDGAGVFMQGFRQGGAVFRRGEGIWFGNGKVYFASTSGGAAGKGQIFELDPRRNELKMIFESPGQAVLDNPDNVAVSPRGGIVLCEDGAGDTLYMRGLTVKGEIFDFARNNVVLDGEVNGFSGDFRDQEWAGASFSPDGEWLFASIQTPGVSFAITGPWHKGAL